MKAFGLCLVTKMCFLYTQDIAFKLYSFLPHGFPLNWVVEAFYINRYKCHPMWIVQQKEIEWLQSRELFFVEGVLPTGYVYNSPLCVKSVWGLHLLYSQYEA